MLQKYRQHSCKNVFRNGTHLPGSNVGVHERHICQRPRMKTRGTVQHEAGLQIWRKRLYPYEYEAARILSVILEEANTLYEAQDDEILSQF